VARAARREDSLNILAAAELVPGVGGFGITAFTTTRSAGSFGFQTDEPVNAVMGRWTALAQELSAGGTRLATVNQVHGADILVHQPGWEGWLRAPAADGHASLQRGTALVVRVADCVPVFIAHPSGVVALLHSGWRGTAARIVERAIRLLGSHGLAPSELHLHTGPAICGDCYEVSASVHAQLTGRDPGRPTTVDLRSLIADHARALGVGSITSSASCTRHDNGRFFSHRAGDDGRQVSVIQATR
jgi:hypothetical protein